MLQKMQQFRPHDATSNRHTSLARRCTAPRAHPSTKEISSRNVSLATALALAAVACSRAHFGRVTTACVSSPKRRGSLHRLAHCSKTWTLLGRLHIEALRSICLTTVHFRKPPSKKLEIISRETQLSFDELFSAPPGATCTELLLFLFRFFIFFLKKTPDQK